MARHQSIVRVSVIWRNKKFVVELNSEASLKELGEELLNLTDVKADTIRLIIPQSSTKSSKMFVPFSVEHSSLKLEDIGIMEGKPLRMMGVSGHEVDQLLKDAKANLRIAGFDDEEKRMKQRISRGFQLPIKLPEGPYIFCGFRTLELPGIELNPPPSEALKRMHMLAADPGIVAIMRKHRWRVGIMTEMAPEGYVGISPVCLLGLNKNQGEEISLRLRTDDLKGFRKYESIKKTLLHELAHMVYSEHDSNFYALDRQLNEEAFALDWTRSRSHTLSNSRFLGHDDMDEEYESGGSLSHKLGGETSHMTASARAASVAAAYNRLADSSTIHQQSNDQDSDNHKAEAHRNSQSLNSAKQELVTGGQPDHCSRNQNMLEPDPDDTEARDNMNLQSQGIIHIESDCDDTEMTEVVPNFTVSGRFDGANLQEEPDPDDSETSKKSVTGSVDTQSVQIETNTSRMRINEEPDPDDLEAEDNAGKSKRANAVNESRENQSQLRKFNLEPDPDDPQDHRLGGPQSNPDDKSENLIRTLGDMTEEPDPDDQELRRIQDPVAAFCDRLTKAIEKLRDDLKPPEAIVVLQTLLRIISNIIGNPNELKYKRLRMANPVFQRSIAYHKVAMDILALIGFGEDIVTDETGKSETYLVLRRNDPAMLWLAKSILETSLAL